MENVLPVLNLSKICRVCLEECDDMFSIYSELFEDNSAEQMPRLFEILVNISGIKVQPGDGYPSMLCTKCVDKAHTSYKFQKMCNTSQSLLENYIDRLEELERLKPIDFPNIETDINSKNELGKHDPKSSNVEIKEEILPPELDQLNKEDLISNDVPLEDTNDCEALKSCLPLGEETIDQLIKDNIDILSPKMQSFNLNFGRSYDEDEFDFGTPEQPGDLPKPNMYYYMKERDNDIPREYICNICQKGFRIASGLRVHLKTHNKEKPYVCSECKKGFKVYGALMHHVRSHSGEQPFGCKICGKQYRQSATLTAHMRIHTGTKPFLCTICDRGFRQQTDLTYHMRTHTKEKPYMCNICGKQMSMQCHLILHMRSHTGEKPFKCPECDKAFPSSTRLKRHSITHTSLKPHKCEICDKSFNRQNSLRMHKKIHSGDKSHVCTICNKGFTWAHSLQAHILSHTVEDCKVKNSIVEKKKTKKVPDVEKDPVPNTKNASSTLESNNTITARTNPSVAKYTRNESYVIHSAGDGNDKETFQIYTLCPEDGIEDAEFTLYATSPVK